MDTESSVSTQASTVYDRLQADILSGELEPGRKLRLKELIEIYDSLDDGKKLLINAVLGVKGPVRRVFSGSREAVRFICQETRIVDTKSFFTSIRYQVERNRRVLRWIILSLFALSATLLIVVYAISAIDVYKSL